MNFLDLVVHAIDEPIRKTTGAVAYAPASLNSEAQIMECVALSRRVTRYVVERAARNEIAVSDAPHLKLILRFDSGKCAVALQSNARRMSCLPRNQHLQRWSSARLCRSSTRCWCSFLRSRLAGAYLSTVENNTVRHVLSDKRQGGDRRSQRIETYSQLILDAVAVKPDITLAELRDLLKRRGISAGIASLWRFFQRRKITLKKRQRTPPSNGAAI